jgi:molecular chaperone GrpE (heat shock protein)
MKRIREIEDKHKFGGAAHKDSKKDDKKEKKEKKDKKEKKEADGEDKKEKKKKVEELEDQVEKLTKERNLLAQKVVNLETQNNKRRSSFSGM